MFMLHVIIIIEQAFAMEARLDRKYHPKYMMQSRMQSLLDYMVSYTK